MTEYTPTAEAICEELGFDPDTTKRAREHTDRRRDRVDNWSGEQTTLELPTGDRIHKHQLVVDSDDGEHFMVKTLNSDRVKLVEVTPPASAGSVGFGTSYWLTIGDFLRAGEPQFAADDTPVWVY